MSSRVIRKLKRETELDPLNAILKQEKDGKGDHSEEEENEEISMNSKKGNIFALLGDDDNEENSENEEESEENEIQKLKKQKKKKKKKPKSKASKHEAEAHEEDDIQKALKELNMSSRDAADAGAGASLSTPKKPILQVEHKHLNPDNEMKRIFGSKVVQSWQRQQQQHKRVRRSNCWLVQPKGSWAPFRRNGLSMKQLESKNRSSYFAFEHSKEYQQVQFRFLDNVESYHPEALLDILQESPYHMDTLLQASDMFRTSDDTQTAVDLLERAIFACENSFHSLFNLSSGTCRLDYRRPENRSFYIALFKYLIFLGLRGCPRTSLEFAKLLLSLDPDGDPLGIFLLIDFFSLRSREYEYFIEFFNCFEPIRNLSLLPNYQFSLPLAKFQLAQTKNDQQGIVQAEEGLRRALISFPSMLMQLLDKCGVNPGKDVEDHWLFSKFATASEPAAVQQLVSLYVGRCYSEWKEPEVVAWLEQVVQNLVKSLEKNDPIVSDMKSKRFQRFKGTPLNVYRHLYLSEIKEVKLDLPPELTGSGIFAFDPLPPKDSILSYQRPPPQQPRRLQGQGAVGMFLRSIWPNFNITEELMNQEANNNGNQEGQEAGAAGGEPWRHGVANLLDAMRELLNTIHFADPQNGNPQQQEEEENEDEWADEDQ